MGFQQYKNVIVKGIAACVPGNIENNRDLPLLGNKDQVQKFIETTGVVTRHTVKNQKLCSSDMCYYAAVTLLNDLNWSRYEIDCLLFVSQTPDYIMPATACISAG